MRRRKAQWPAASGEAERRFLGRDGQTTFATSGADADFLQDLYVHLLTASWTRLLLLLSTAYIGANALFGALYLLQSDCIENARPGSYEDAFFFSVQTMATVGYGKMSPVTAYASTLASIESFAGLLGLALVTGLVFAKFSRPTARVRFSSRAVITRRNGVPCLMFRMANQRRNQIVEAHVHVVVARTETTAEGETIRRLVDLALLRADHVLFSLSWTVIHPIDEASPFFEATPESIAADNAEMIVSVTGLDETVSQTVHARHSYIASEIAWNCRFADIISQLPDGRNLVDYAKFDDVVPELSRGDAEAKRF